MHCVPLLAALILLLGGANGQGTFNDYNYSGPFTLISSTGLAFSADVSKNFGPEDKLLVCNNNLVFINLDNATGVTTTYNGVTWTQTNIIANPCPDPGNPPLIPRDSGYTVGIADIAGGGQRLLIIGGDNSENNIYYSDDCGFTFNCYDGPQDFSPRSFAIIWHGTGIIPGDPVFMAGGLADETVASTGIFENVNNGVNTWTRPVCDNSTGPCPNAFTDPGYWVMPCK